MCLSSERTVLEDPRIEMTLDQKYPWNDHAANEVKVGIFFTCVPSITEAQTNFRCHNIFINRVLDYPTFRHCFVIVSLPTLNSMNSLNRSLLFHIVLTDSEIHPKTICY